jgi:hypothetical protein
MIVDCDSCTVRGDACGECVITVLLGAPPGKVELDSTERQALDTLAAAGMVPRLQLVNHDDGGRDVGEQGHAAQLADREGRIHGEVRTRSYAERSAGHVERSKRRVG